MPDVRQGLPHRHAGLLAGRQAHLVVQAEGAGQPRLLGQDQATEPSRAPREHSHQAHQEAGLPPGLPPGR
eukprot:11173451-Lingulodinium_polyedra.AAC.1